MTAEEIRTTICQLLRNIAPDTEPEKLQPDENIRETLDIDSMDFLRFIIALDEKFDVKTPEEDYGKINTLAKLVAYISSQKK